MAPNRRIDYRFVGPPTSGGRGHVTDCELFGTDVVLTADLGAKPSAMWPSDHAGLLASIRY